MRAILLAAALPATDASSFWSKYASGDSHLAGLTVHDPFMGGGTTLVEAARMGAAVAGSDIDPISTQIVQHALRGGDGPALAAAGDSLMEFLRQHFGGLYPQVGGDALHYFWLHVVTCPQCSEAAPLYRSLVLARDSAKVGAVVRDDGLTALDPTTMTLVHFKNPGRKELRRGRRRIRLEEGNYRAGRFRCESCGRASTHAELQTGAQPRQLVAVERTPLGARRKLTDPDVSDFAAVQTAQEMLDEPPVPLDLPHGEFPLDRKDGRPRTYGITSVRELFTARQLLVLGAASAWIRLHEGIGDETRIGLRTAVSNALTTNNILCSYATDYGRLSALFSVRGYSLPWLPVELNPLHRSGGRGTLSQCIDRVVRSYSTKVRRYYWSTADEAARSQVFDLPTTGSEVEVVCAAAADFLPTASVDLVAFDPPYYDFIEYDELAELYRAWQPGVGMAGTPLQSAARDAEGSFGTGLAESLAPALRARRGEYPIAFTYHSANPEAWGAIGVALDEAKLRVTALWPVRSDGHMGHHSNPGNCEWDVVVVARPLDETLPRDDSAPIDLLALCGDFEVRAADEENLRLAAAMAHSRMGTVRHQEEVTNGR